MHGKISDQGFALAVSDPGPINNLREKTYINGWKFEHSGLTGIFELETFKDFIGIQKPSLSDESSNTNYFGIADEKRVTDLIEALKSDTRPELFNLLNENDIFINLYVGLDYGYPDSILIKTKSDIGSRLNELIKEFQIGIEKFQLRMVDSYEMNDFTDAIAELVNL